MRARRSAPRSSGWSSIRCSWVGTSEVDQPSPPGHACSGSTGSCPATSERTTTCTPATYVAGNRSTHGPEPPRRRSVAATEASTAARASTTRLGRPEEPEVSTTRRTSSGPSSQPRSWVATSAGPPDGWRRLTRETLLRAPTAPAEGGGDDRHRLLLESVVVATPAQWLAGARPRTLPAAIAPVLAGTGVAAYADGLVVGKALLALVVSLALQVAVNYANDYSDGIRGTDDDRVGPMRLVGSGAAPAYVVKRAAFAAFGVAGVAGLVLAATTAWWLVLVGVVCVLAAWFYTGGERPYGYLGLGEVMVFVFFGLVAVIGTTYVQTRSWEWAALYAGVGVGALACAILVANNLRDIPTDTHAGKRTLAVRMGADRTRGLYALLVLAAAGAVVAVAVATTWWVVVGLGFLALAFPATRTVLRGATGPGLVPVLQQTGLAELLWAVLVAGALVLAS